MAQRLPRSTPITIMQFQSLSAISGTILSIFSTKKRDRISAKTECFVLTDDQVLSRITLWAPNDRCDLETFGSIVVKNARKLNYYGDCFSTCSISAVHRTPASQIESLNHLRWVKQVGGIRFEVVETLRERVSDEKAAFGFVKGQLFGYEKDFVYQGCPECKKKMDQSCKVHQKVPESLMKLVLFLDHTKGVIKVTVFREVFDTLLQQDTRVFLKTEEGIGKIITILDQCTGRQMGMGIMAQKRSFESEGEDVTFIQLTARAPLFVFE